MAGTRFNDVVRKWAAAIALLAMVAGAVGVGAFMIIGSASQPPPQPTAAPAFTPPTPKVPIPAEFDIGVIVTGQECDPAGACFYTYNIEPKYIGMHPLPDTEFTVEFEVTGGHQPQSGSFTVQGPQARILQNVTIEGPPDAQLQAAVTGVIG